MFNSMYTIFITIINILKNVLLFAYNRFIVGTPINAIFRGFIVIFNRWGVLIQGVHLLVPYLMSLKITKVIQTLISINRRRWEILDTFTKRQGLSESDAELGIPAYPILVRTRVKFIDLDYYSKYEQYYIVYRFVFVKLLMILFMLGTLSVWFFIYEDNVVQRSFYNVYLIVDSVFWYFFDLAKYGIFFLWINNFFYMVLQGFALITVYPIYYFNVAICPVLPTLYNLLFGPELMSFIYSFFTTEENKLYYWRGLADFFLYYYPCYLDFLNKLIDSLFRTPREDLELALLIVNNSKKIIYLLTEISSMTNIWFDSLYEEMIFLKEDIATYSYPFWKRIEFMHYVYPEEPIYEYTYEYFKDPAGVVYEKRIPIDVTNDHILVYPILINPDPRVVELTTISTDLEVLGKFEAFNQSQLNFFRGHLYFHNENLDYLTRISQTKHWYNWAFQPRYVFSDEYFTLEKCNEAKQAIMDLYKHQLFLTEYNGVEDGFYDSLWDTQQTLFDTPLPEFVIKQKNLETQFNFLFSDLLTMSDDLFRQELINWYSEHKSQVKFDYKYINDPQYTELDRDFLFREPFYTSINRVIKRYMLETDPMNLFEHVERAYYKLLVDYQFELSYPIYEKINYDELNMEYMNDLADQEDLNDFMDEWTDPEDPFNPDEEADDVVVDNYGQLKYLLEDDAEFDAMCYQMEQMKLIDIDKQIELNNQKQVEFDIEQNYNNDILKIQQTVDSINATLVNEYLSFIENNALIFELDTTLNKLSRQTQENLVIYKAQYDLLTNLVESTKSYSTFFGFKIDKNITDTVIDTNILNLQQNSPILLDSLERYSNMLTEDETKFNEIVVQQHKVKLIIDETWLKIQQLEKTLLPYQSQIKSIELLKPSVKLMMETNSITNLLNSIK